jgi:hypothetical protein
MVHRHCQVDEVSTNIGSSSAMMTTSTTLDHGDRFPSGLMTARLIGPH